jgi:hypothetical protein
MKIKKLTQILTVFTLIFLTPLVIKIFKLNFSTKDKVVNKLQIENNQEVLNKSDIEIKNFTYKGTTKNKDTYNFKALNAQKIGADYKMQNIQGEIITKKENYTIFSETGDMKNNFITLENNNIVSKKDNFTISASTITIDIKNDYLSLIDNFNLIADKLTAKADKIIVKNKNDTIEIIGNINIVIK